MNKNKYKTCTKLGELFKHLNKDQLKQFIFFLRKDYIESNITPSLEKLFKKSNTIFDYSDNRDESLIYHRLAENFGIKWDEFKFHLDYRIHLNHNSSDADFAILFDNVNCSLNDQKTLKQLIREGEQLHDNGILEHRYYDLSVLPLNLYSHKTVLNYFIPSSDYFSPHSTKNLDPYGILTGRSRVEKEQSVAIIDNEKKLVLGTHKFSNTLLFNVDFYCPVGCSNCYKTRMGTREYIDRKRTTDKTLSNIFLHPDFGEVMLPSKNQVIEQVKQTVQWMNNHPRGKKVYDVIISGGEPLVFKNETLKLICNEFEKAKNLHILRICTGTLFLGLPFRIDKELLNLLEDFSERTGVKITFQAHLGNHHMISPESIIAVNKIRQRGIPIYSQIPIKNNINFFLDDIDKTMRYLIELGKKQVMVGVEPYMFIVDMHPRTNANYIPLEPLLQVWGMLVESHDLPGLERPRTLSILFEQGNIILSGHILFSAIKTVDNQNDRVIYHIPRISGSESWETRVAEVFTYEEPLLEGLNDNPNSLDELKKTFKNLL